MDFLRDDELIVEQYAVGYFNDEDKCIPVEAKGQAGLVLVVFVDNQAALGEVGLVVDMGHSFTAVSEFDAEHPQRVLLTEVDPGVPHVHQPFQQREEILSVGRYGLGDGLLQLSLGGEGAAEWVAGLDPFLSHCVSS